MNKPESTQPIAVIVMGVQGSGKSTVGPLLSQELLVPFIDGDDLHPDSNRVKMASGTPLNDDDRRPWLTVIGQRIAAETAQGQGVVIACSALKRSYRDLIRSEAPETIFLYLAGGRSLVHERVTARSTHFMPPALLASQFETLEVPDPDETHVTVDISLSIEEVVSMSAAGLRAVLVSSEHIR